MRFWLRFSAQARFERAPPQKKTKPASEDFRSQLVCVGERITCISKVLIIKYLCNRKMSPDKGWFHITKVVLESDREWMGLFLLQLNIGLNLESALIRSLAVTILRAVAFRGHFRGYEFTAILYSVHILKRDGHRGQIVYCPG